MRIVSAASAFPKNYYPQHVLAGAFHKYLGSKLQRPSMLDWLHQRVGVDGRYLAYPMENYENLRDFGQANDLWIEASQELGQQAMCHALNRAGLAREDLSALFFVYYVNLSDLAVLRPPSLSLQRF